MSAISSSSSKRALDLPEETARPLKRPKFSRLEGLPEEIIPDLQVLVRSYAYYPGEEGATAETYKTWAAEIRGTSLENFLITEDGTQAEQLIQAQNRWIHYISTKRHLLNKSYNNPFYPQNEMPEFIDRIKFRRDHSFKDIQSLYEKIQRGALLHCYWKVFQNSPLEQTVHSLAAEESLSLSDLTKNMRAAFSSQKGKIALPPDIFINTLSLAIREEFDAAVKEVLWFMEESQVEIETPLAEGFECSILDHCARADFFSISEQLLLYAKKEGREDLLGNLIEEILPTISEPEIGDPRIGLIKKTLHLIEEHQLPVEGFVISRAIRSATCSIADSHDNSSQKSQASRILHTVQQIWLDFAEKNNLSSDMDSDDLTDALECQTNNGYLTAVNELRSFIDKKGL